MNKSTIIILQARTNSARLPAKVLLPINEIPAVVLAAKRAQNTGLPLVVVTSNESSDDALVDLLTKYDINYYRGSLDNVLSRFIGALKNYDASTTVVRLTADNTFPDGQFIQKILDKFHNEDYQYLCTESHTHFPYGLSVEVTKLSHLREAADKATCSYDLEHVTPYIRKKFGEHYYSDNEFDAGNYRCTIDCLDDYINIQRIFKTTNDPIGISTKQLVSILKAQNPEQVVARKTLSNFVLGTAQLGMDYGINNTDGQPDFCSAQNILKTAISNGIVCLDTARAYGQSEMVISGLYQSGWKNRFHLITKLYPLSNQYAHVQDRNIIHALTSLSVYESLYNLNTDCIDTLLLHRAADISLCDHAVWEQLLTFKQKGIINTLGVSVQSPEELLSVLHYSDIEHIQIPYNILDHRWDKAIAEVIKTKQSRKLIIHTRSVFLQGLLLSDNAQHWLQAHIENYPAVLFWLEQTTKKYQRKNIADLCIAYVQAQPWADGLVIGVESFDQLMSNISLFINPSLTLDQINEIIITRPTLLPNSLNPAKWNN